MKKNETILFVSTYCVIEKDICLTGRGNGMIQPNIQLLHDHIVIHWCMATIRIPVADIIEIVDLHNPTSHEKPVIRIGDPNGTKAYSCIRTKKADYLIYSNDQTWRTEVLSC